MKIGNMIRIKKKFLFLFLLLIGSDDLYSQNIKLNHFTNSTIDSLIAVLGKTREDSLKLKTLRNLYSNAYDLVFYNGSNDYSLVIKYVNDAAILSDKLGDRYEKGQAIKKLGEVEYEKGDLSEALNHFLFCLRNAEDMGDKACASNQYYAIAMIYSDLGNDTLAFNYYLISLKMQKELAIKNILPNTYNRIAGIYEAWGNYREALTNYKLGLEVARETKFKLFEGVIYKGIGNTYLQLKNYKLASGYLFASLKIMEELNNEFYKTELINHIGHYYAEYALVSTGVSSRKLFDSSIYYLLKAERLGRKFNYNWMLINTYKQLSKVYKEVGDYRNALSYLELYSNSNDSFSTMKSKNLVTDLNKKNETEKRDFLSKIQIEKIETEKKNRRKLLIIGASSILLIAIIFLFYNSQRYQKKRAIEKAETNHKMAAMELQSLRSQLNPHFMFNSLNSIQALILKEDTEKSQSYLARFSKLLRMLLDNADKQFIPLSKEMEILQLYLGLEHLRVPDLQYAVYTDPSINTEQILIPNMILQPYVENAIWHGLSYKLNNKQLQIRISREKGTIIYEIEDNGVGRKKAEELKSLFRKQHESKGMKLLSKRISLLNNEYLSTIESEIKDVIKNNEVCGTLVSIKMPVMQQDPVKN